ncbi:ATP-binding protein [Shewanella algae]|uniref:ATP-binding protein n=1 Tax=Shewanella algae TaxID=38313 RepID=UPI000C34A4F3|nr:ATP-binding protein [Shewanella algae]MBO2643137.1 ATP-binding protein [Shewanella algae]
MTQLRVRARAVDMLGRQQIAGIPTAIHELFKNAHDAYAERVEVDFFRKTRVLVLRDDGYGMTREDLESRWLTLGTESRVSANKKKSKQELDEEWRGPKHLPPRVIMGEKGIGRLAIAVIAPITLLMSRASRADGLHNLVVTLVHWGLFEQPGLDISEIDIPIMEFEAGTLPGRADICALADAVEKNIDSLKEDISAEIFVSLQESLKKAREIAPDQLDLYLNKDVENKLSLRGDGYGTHFIVLPVAPELDDDIDGGADKEASKLEKNLLGFSNTMSGVEPVIKTEFRDHKLSKPDSLIGSASFFNEEDFNTVDHIFDGTFDEHGQFVGTVAIYGKPREFVCNWTEGRGRLARCGGFSIRYWYVQGREKESSLNADSWQNITKKLDRIGGLYIYRNGIRILPYGDTDYDFLGIEKRRTKSAQDWFFSYRRLFGYISISHEDNAALTEKAGREGFRENQAYRDFRAILINFFEQLALEFFRPTSPQGEDFWETKEENLAQDLLLKKQKKKADNRREDFKNELAQFFTLYEGNFFEQESTRIKEEFTARLDNLEIETDTGELALAVRKLELEIRNQIRVLHNRNRLNRPRGLALTKSLEKDWQAYERMSLDVKETVLEPLNNEIDSQLRLLANDKIGNAQRRESAIQYIESERDATVRELQALRRDTVVASDKMVQSLKDLLKSEFAAMREETERLVGEFTRRSAATPQSMDSDRNQVEQEILQLRIRETDLLDSLRRQMIELAEGLQSRETLDDRFAALENTNQILEEQLNFYSDFALMGMSVGILQHEFERAARGIRVAMADLKPWADTNPPLAVIYRHLRDHIEHLDGYLKALDPVGRRIHRASIKLSGDEILNTLRRVFVEQLDESGIELQVTDKFRDSKILCKSSTVIGAFINLVDNAIYWLNNGAKSERKIFLDVDDKGFLISNTGPGIEERFRERIFDFGETKKPGGRGMGLAVSRDTLRREGMDIVLLQCGLDKQPVFQIVFNKD